MVDFFVSLFEKQMVAKTKKEEVLTQLINQLPLDLLNEVGNAAMRPPPRVADMNCGKFINTMSNRYHSLKDYKRQLQTSVIKTLERFEIILLEGFYLRNASASPSPSMWTRVRDALHDARKAPTVEKLVNLCQQIPLWKQEAKKIVQKLEELAQHIEQYLSTGKTTLKPNALGVRLVPASRFLFFQKFQTLHRVSDGHIISTELQTLRQNLQKDVAALAILSAPLQIVPDPRNCGEYLRINPTTIHSLYDPRTLTSFKDIVVKTLRHFCRDLENTKFIKKSAIVDPGNHLQYTSVLRALDTRPMNTRVKETLESIQDFQHPVDSNALDSNALIIACAKVASWKKESALIVTRLEEYIKYLETYVETGKRQGEPLKNIVVDSMKASMHKKVPKLVWDRDRRLLLQYIGQYKACLEVDREWLQVLLATIDVR